MELVNSTSWEHQRRGALLAVAMVGALSSREWIASAKAARKKFKIQSGILSGGDRLLFAESIIRSVEGCKERDPEVVATFMNEMANPSPLNKMHSDVRDYIRTKLFIPLQVIS